MCDRIRYALTCRCILVLLHSAACCIYIKVKPARNGRTFDGLLHHVSLAIVSIPPSSDPGTTTSDGNVAWLTLRVQSAP